MPGGGLMQLVAYGAQDIFLTDISYESVTEEKLIWNEINKILDLNKNSECPITYDELKHGCKYCVCHQCKYNFSTDGLMECFKKMQKNCPICKTKWENWTVYTNC